MKFFKNDKDGVVASKDNLTTIVRFYCPHCAFQNTVEMAFNPHRPMACNTFACQSCGQQVTTEVSIRADLDVRKVKRG